MSNDNARNYLKRLLTSRRPRRRASISVRGNGDILAADILVAVAPGTSFSLSVLLDRSICPIYRSSFAPIEPKVAGQRAGCIPAIVGETGARLGSLWLLSCFQVSFIANRSIISWRLLLAGLADSCAHQIAGELSWFFQVMLLRESFLPLRASDEMSYTTMVAANYNLQSEDPAKRFTTFLKLPHSQNLTS